MKAFLALEDGSVFEGSSCGAPGEAAGEAVFNTAWTGYQEILSDPSYKGQILAMTYPLIGNRGVSPEDMESKRPLLSGLVVRELCRRPFLRNPGASLDDFLARNGIVAMEGVDTRELTLLLREKGALRAVISTRTASRRLLVQKARRSPLIKGSNLAISAGTSRPYFFPPSSRGTGKVGGLRIAVYDFGLKFGILRFLERMGVSVTVLPAGTPAQDALNLKPDGILLSNGPGDPSAMTESIETAGRLARSGVPVIGICLGHQLLGLAFGAGIKKLRFGHHGTNHPVRDLESGRVAITSHNHDFVLDSGALPRSLRVTHQDLTDASCEGMRHAELPVSSVQFHPEASAGPHDGHPVLSRFVEGLRGRRRP